MDRRGGFEGPDRRDLSGPRRGGGASGARRSRHDGEGPPAARMNAPTLIALLHGPDQPGLVARVAGWIFERGGNILHADQHRDMEAGVFFQRVEWQPAMPATGAAAAGMRSLAEAEAAFTAFATSIGMKVRILSSVDR